ncbi:MAG: flagellar motor switch protein FliG [Candidatus Omnitrophica bacterium]|nr:flagellar motor switch protein FliG [Candidatus Omnitrophota bacterium]MCM8826383.1 flagellar motor switch protein FliG [Candidatus Omnitrophota bacterium]
MPEVAIDNYKKVAILLVALGIDVAAQVFKYLDEREIELISKEIAHLETVDKILLNEIILEFYEKLLSLASAEGGMEYLKEVLERALGPSKTMGIIRHLSDVQPFSFLENASASQIADFLSAEDPQVIALVLSYLTPTQASAVFSQFTEELRKQIAVKMVSLKEVHREVIDNTHRALERVMASKEKSVSQIISFEGTGIKNLANILNAAPHQIEKGVLDHLKSVDSELAEEVRKNMFLFEDLVSLDDVSLQKVLRQVDMRDLTLALKMSEEKLKEKIFNNLSERVREICKEELQYLGPVRLRQVEEAQQKIINIVRKLEATGEVVIPRKGEEEEFV